MDMIFDIKVVKVTDGDTIHVVADLGFKIHTTQIIRLKGVNCPEINTPEGQAAKAFTEQWLQIHQGKLMLDCHGQDKYAGRWLGTIQSFAGGTLQTALLLNQHAK